MPTSSYNLARRQILNNAIRRHQKSLDLGNKGLDKLPREIGQAIDLEHLTLSDNNLNELPSEIFHLSRLKNLYIDGNHLEEIVADLGRMKNLRSLNASDNLLRSIPDTIGKLILLDDINVSNNPITELPDTFNSLQNLTTLDLSDTRITNIPESIFELEKLTYLDLSNTNITKLSNSIVKLQELRFLNLSNTRISNLPSNFGHLKNLRDLNLEGCHLSQAPESFSQLTEIDVLNVSGVFFEDWANVISILPNVEVLNASYGLPDISKILRYCGQLVDLDISNCDLNDIPLEVCLMKSLKRLKASGNRLIGLPLTLASLGDLREVNIMNNKVNDFPEVIVALQKLEYLNVSRNAIVSIPDRISALKRLKSIDLRTNRLQTMPMSIGLMGQFSDQSHEPNQPPRGIFFDDNPLHHPLSIIASLNQPQATEILQRFLRGELSPGEINDLTEEQSDEARLPALVKQGPGPHFDVDEKGLVSFSPPKDIDSFGNNIRRLKAIHPTLIEMIRSIIQDLSEGNAPHWDLLEKAKSYANIIDQPLNAVDFNILYVQGVRLENAEASDSAASRAHELPSLEIKTREALSSLIQIHGTFMLSTADGMELISQEQRYQRTPQLEAAFRKDAVNFATTLVDSPEIIDKNAAKFILESVAEIGSGRNVERSDINATNVIRNSMIVLTTAATVTAVGSSLAAGNTNIAPYVVAASTMVFAESFKKSKIFTDVQSTLTTGIDSIYLNEVQTKWNYMIEVLRPQLSYLQKNRDLILSLSKFDPSFSWVSQSIEWIRKRQS